jgi:hypothetical protein
MGESRLLSDAPRQLRRGGAGLGRGPDTRTRAGEGPRVEGLRGAPTAGAVVSLGGIDGHAPHGDSEQSEKAGGWSRNPAADRTWPPAVDPP